jgi:hypothetical protein
MYRVECIRTDILSLIIHRTVTIWFITAAVKLTSSGIPGNLIKECTKFHTSYLIQSPFQAARKSSYECNELKTAED